MVCNVDDFLVTAHSVQEANPEQDTICLRVHGISPSNSPLGFREYFITHRDLLNIEWAAQIHSLWHFQEFDLPRITYVARNSGQTQGTHEVPTFNFIVSFARGHSGTAVMVHQEIRSPTSSHCEHWAVMLNRRVEEGEVFNQLWRPPFWFHRDIRTILRRDGRHLDEMEENWRPGECLDLTLHTDTNAQLVMTLLEMRNEMEARIDYPRLDHVYLLQTKSVVRKTMSPFQEICLEMLEANKTEREQEIATTPDTGASPTQAFAADRPPFARAQLGELDEQAIQIASLKCIVQDLMKPTWKGLNTDFAILDNLHPIARHAIDATHFGRHEATRFHIFTDGSEKDGIASWAFVVLNEVRTSQGSSFFRVGYAGGLVSLPDGQVPTALDAEAEAVIAMADYLLSRKWVDSLEVHCHYDSMAIGAAAFGEQAIPHFKTNRHSKAFQARIIMSLVQRKFAKCKGLHVHSHEGNPFNELADGIAAHIRKGNAVPVPALLRVEPLMQHPLREWAWMEVSPTIELPSLDEVTRDAEVWESRAWLDPTLEKLIHERQVHATETASIKVATANVGTCEYNAGDHALATSMKVKDLAHQFHNKGWRIVALQETRAKFACQVREGPFDRVISPAAKGQGGVELWFHMDLIQRDLCKNFNLDHDVVTWHHDHRTLAVHVNFGSFQVDIVNIYAPQRGRPIEEVNTWWQNLDAVLKKRPTKCPIWIMGDCNASLGSVCSNAIGDNDPDLEDAAGSLIHQLCQDHNLFAPSTWDTVHTGQSWTYHGPHGERKGLDFFLISQECRNAVAQTQVDPDVELLNGTHDHVPLEMCMHITYKQADNAGAVRASTYDRVAAREDKHAQTAILQALPVVPWQVHTNEHWSMIRHTCQTEASKRYPKKKRQQRQIYFTQQSWDLVCHRKDIKNLHRQNSKNKDRNLLRMIFGAWAHRSDHSLQEQRHCLNLQGAVYFEQQQLLDAKYRKLKKKDWKVWAHKLLEKQIDSLATTPGANLFQMLQPKRAIDKSQGKSRKHVPGIKDQDGKWCLTRSSIAWAWQSQFGKIENAVPVGMDHFSNEKDTAQERFAQIPLAQIPTILDLEWAFRCMNPKKAPGLDAVGAEIFQQSLPYSTMRVWPLFLKQALRQQWAPEHAGGWMIALFKGKGDKSSTSTHRGIMLEPVLARCFSRTWRGVIEQGVANTAQPNQFGGRAGLSCTSLHLQMRLSQQIAAGKKLSQGIVFVDFKSAFYSVAKDLLVSHKRSAEDFIALCQSMRIPQSAREAFANNLSKADTIWRCTGSQGAAAMVAASLRRTWFLVPHASQVMAPCTGSRPGDPLADLLFTTIMTEMLGQIHEKGEACDIWSHDDQTEAVASSVTWVDDVAFSIQSSAFGIRS